MNCLEWLPTVAQAWKGVLDFLNTAFASAFVSALAGAGLGVLGAQRFAERTTERKELTEAIQQSNAITVLTHTISTQALSLKKQHVTPLSVGYFRDRDSAEAANSQYLAGTKPATPFRFEANFLHLSPLLLPIDALKSIAYSAQLMPGRAIALVAMIEQSVTELNNSLRMRSELISAFKERNLQGIPLAQLYFGLDQGRGNVDRIYHDLMQAIVQYTDDVAFYAAELADEIQIHAKRVHIKLVPLKKDARKPSSVDFSDARASGLIPPRDQYKSWLDGFKSSSANSSN